MPKSIPTNGQTNWGTALNSHLAQLMDPTTGGFNIVQDEADRNAKYPNLTANDDQLTVYNIDTGTFQVYDVSNVSGARWIDLQKDKGVSIVKVSGTMYTRYNVSDNTYDIIGTGVDFTKLSQSFQGATTFTVYNNANGNIKLASFTTADIQNATTLRNKRIAKEIVPLNQTISRTYGSDITTVQNTSVLTVGDAITVSTQSDAFTVKEILSATTIRTATVSQRTYVNSPADTSFLSKIYTQSDNQSIYITTSSLSIKDESNNSAVEFLADGSVVANNGVSLGNKNGGIVSLDNNAIYDSAKNTQSFLTINSQTGVKTGETNSSGGLGMVLNVSRYHDPLNPNSYTGTLLGYYGVLVQSGHVGTANGTTNSIQALAVRFNNRSGTVGKALGLFLEDYSTQAGSTGTLTGFYHPIFDASGTGGNAGKTFSYFGSPIVIGGASTVLPQAKLHVNGGITLENNGFTPLMLTNKGKTTAGLSGKYAFYNMAAGDAGGLGQNCLCIYSYNLDGNTKSIPFTILDNDNVGISTTAPSQRLHVAGNILATGTVTQNSDITLKKDIVKIDGALNKLSQIKGVTYKWKKPENHGDDETEQLGIIAQDVEKVFPQAVSTDPNGIKSVSYGDMVAPLIEAVKELTARVKELEAKVK
jgi:Chaperone of endosialidase